jgi:SecD/SecF fusion protein
MEYRTHPLFEKFFQAGEGAIAFVLPQDTAFVGEYLRADAVRDLFPSDLQFAWSATTTPGWNAHEDKKGFILYALKIPKDGARIRNAHIESAQVEYDGRMGQQIVNITMAESGAVRWKKMTSENIGRCLAITVNGTVYSCPMVHEAISGGQTQISGQFTVEEAQELAWAIRP